MKQTSDLSKRAERSASMLDSLAIAFACVFGILSVIQLLVLADNYETTKDYPLTPDIITASIYGLIAFAGWVFFWAVSVIVRLLSSRD